MSRSHFSRTVFAILIVSALRATAQDMIFSPANLRFGKVAVGQRSVRTVTITNLGDSSVTLLQATTNGTGFTLSGLDLPLTLERGERFTFSGIFAPQADGDARGTISFVSETSSVAKPSPMLGMMGTGINSGQLTVDPASINFGMVAVGSFASQGATLTAPSGSVTVSSANISDAEFTITGLSFPFTIPSGASQGYTVLFAPQTSGTVSATLSFLADDGTSLTVQALTGVGVAAHSHSVDLSWNPSTSQDVIGYNVYRGNTSGGPYSKINTVLDASTAYTDGSVSDGNTYYYVTTAVDSSNQESVYSNQAQAVIPGEDSGVQRFTRGSTLRRRIAVRSSSSRNR